MNKYVQAKEKNKKIICISVIIILIIGIVGFLIFNQQKTDNVSVKSKNDIDKENQVLQEHIPEEKKEDLNEIQENKKEVDKNKISRIFEANLKNSNNAGKTSQESKKSDAENKSNKQNDNISSKNNVSNNKNSSNKSNNSSDTGNLNNSNASISKPSHEHIFNIPVIQKVHHNAVTKNETVTVVDQAAYDETIYESHQVCKVCGKDFGKGEDASIEAINHSIDTGHSYHSTSVKVGTKHHDAITHQETKTIVVTPAYDEEKVIGYKCTCGKNK